MRLREFDFPLRTVSKVASEVEPGGVQAHHPVCTAGVLIQASDFITGQAAHGPGSYKGTAYQPERSRMAEAAECVLVTTESPAWCLGPGRPQNVSFELPKEGSSSGLGRTR